MSCGYDTFDHVRSSGRGRLNLVQLGNQVELNPFRLSLVEHHTMTSSRFNPFESSNVNSFNPFGLSYIECRSVTFDRFNKADPSGSSGGILYGSLTQMPSWGSQGAITIVIALASSCM